MLFRQITNLHPRQVVQYQMKIFTRSHHFNTGNCHAYMWCLDMDDEGEDSELSASACFFDCDPPNLIFDPQTELCLIPEAYPPGLCCDTPGGPCMDFECEATDPCNMP